MSFSPPFSVPFLDDVAGAGEEGEIDLYLDGPAVAARGNETADVGAQCIHRTLRVLKLLASACSHGVKLVEIADGLELSRPTVHRILKALEMEGLVERAQGSRRYTIGSELVWLGLGAYARFPITRIAAGALDRLSTALQDSIFLAVRSGHDTVYADRRLGSHPIQADSLSIGSRRPLGVSVAGRVILGFMSNEARNLALQVNLSRYAEFGCRVEDILKEASTARRQGYVCAESAVGRDKRVLSVPVFNVAGAPVAAISVIAHKHRLPAARISTVLPILNSAAREISEGLQNVQRERLSRRAS